jgi:hypothetical protein
MFDLGLFLAIAFCAVASGPRALAEEMAGPTLNPVEPQIMPPAPQSPGTGYESLPAVPGPMVPPATVPSAIAPTVPCSTCGPDGYWIVSSWKCRQTAPHGCCGDLEFYHRDNCGPTQLLNRDAFHASLAPGTPVCVVVHGSFTNWKGLCDDCGPVYRWLRSAAPTRPLAVVFFTWPSSGPITYEPHIDVAILGMRASFNSIYLGDLIARIPSGHPICIIGHSHGARMTAAALHLLAGGDVDDTRLSYLPPADQRIRSVLIAAALDHQWLDPGQRFGLALCRTECLLYMRNDHDIVLTFYPLRRVFSRRALGEKGLSGRDRDRLGYLNAKVVQLDVTRVIQSGHMWNHYYTHPELAAAIEPYVYFDDAPPNFVPAPQANSQERPATLSGDSLAGQPLAETTDQAEPHRGVLTGLRTRFLSTASTDSPR